MLKCFDGCCPRDACVARIYEGMNKDMISLQAKAKHPQG